MNAVFAILAVQAALGGFDNLWHHELHARLPQRASARHELALHATREAIYALVFAGLAWFEWHGALALILAALLVAELGITLADFLEEDRTRKLPPFERVLHTVLAVSYGAFLGTLAPHLWAWGALPTRLAWTPHGGVSWAFSLCALGLAAWSTRNAIAVRASGSPSLALAPHGNADRILPAVLVTGATGFVGTALVTQLRRDGQRVIVLTRDVQQARAAFGPGVWVVDDLDAIPSETLVDAVVNLAGARVLGLPWTARRRVELLRSRTEVTAAVVGLMRRLQHRPRVLVSASAVGFYGASPGASFEPCHEGSPARPGQFQSDLCAAIEHEARRAEALDVRVVRLRLGVVLGRHDGAYPMLALSSRLGGGTVLGSGRQPAPWIHLDDAVGLIRFAVTHAGLSGPVNAVAPDVTTQATFAHALAASFGRRAWLRMPQAPMRWALGEMAELLLEGQNAVPTAALAAGYKFRHPTLDGALEALAGRGVAAETEKAGMPQGHPSGKPPAQDPAPRR